jgi:glyoxylase-like metal-dependent hydrolase (beta-lactamase superfamily II)
VYAYVVLHPEGPLIFDTGIGEAHPGIDALYRPSRRSLDGEISNIGLATDDIRHVVNSHLHFDHCGGNPSFPRRPIHAQRREHRATREPVYTLSDRVDFPGARLVLIEGETSPCARVTIVPTPGHTAGHQSLAVATDGGVVVLAGQAAYTADEFDAPEVRPHPRGMGAAWDAAEYVRSIRRLKSLRPRRVYFAHDGAVWEP